MRKKHTANGKFEARGKTKYNLFSEPPEDGPIKTRATDGVQFVAIIIVLPRVACPVLMEDVTMLHNALNRRLTKRGR